MQCAILHNSGNGVIIHIELMLRHQAPALMCVRKALWERTAREQVKQNKSSSDNNEKMKPLWIGCMVVMVMAVVWQQRRRNFFASHYSKYVEAWRLFDSRQMNKGTFHWLGHCVCNYERIVILCDNFWANLLESLSYFFIVFNSVRETLCVWLFFFTFSLELFAFGAIATLWSTFVALQLSFTTHSLKLKLIGFFLSFFVYLLSIALHCSALPSNDGLNWPYPWCNKL